MTEEWKKKPWKDAGSHDWKNASNNSWKSIPIWKNFGAGLNDYSSDSNLSQLDTLVPGLYYNETTTIGNFLPGLLHFLGIPHSNWSENSTLAYEHIRINASDLPPNPSFLEILITYAANQNFRIRSGIRRSLGLFVPNLSKEEITSSKITLKDTIENINNRLPISFYRQGIINDLSQHKLKFVNLPNSNTVISLNNIRKRFNELSKIPQFHDVLKEFEFLRDLDALFFCSMLYSYVQIGELYMSEANVLGGYDSAIRDLEFMKNANYYLDNLYTSWLPVERIYSLNTFGSIEIEYPGRMNIIPDTNIIRYSGYIQGLENVYGDKFMLTIDVKFSNDSENGKLDSSHLPPIPEGIDREMWEYVFGGIGIVLL